jgi:hypothetical protein
VASETDRVVCFFFGGCSGIVVEDPIGAWISCSAVDWKVAKSAHLFLQID